MERDSLQRRASSTIKQMGVNTYSQLMSAFRAQGDLSDEKLNLLPTLQNVFGISRERHTAEIKRALNDEQLSDIVSTLNSSSCGTNWELQANYQCPQVVHRPPRTDKTQFAEEILKITPPVTTIQYPSSDITTKINPDLKQAMKDIVKYDGIRNASQPIPANLMSRQKSSQSSTTEFNGVHANRHARMKQGIKPKSSLDTLIEVVQKDLLHVREHSSISSLPHDAFVSKHQIKASSQTNINRPIISGILPVSYPSSQSNFALKMSSKPTLNSATHLKRLSSYQQHHQHRSGHLEYATRRSEQESSDRKISIKSEPETLDDIVRDVVEKLVTATVVNTTPFMTYFPHSSLLNGQSSESKSTSVLTGVDNYPTIKLHTTVASSSGFAKSDSIRNEVATKIIDARTSSQQTSPIKVQPHVYHPQLLLHSNNSSNTSTATTNLPGSAAPAAQTVLVTPRIINFQAVVPKAPTNIQIGNTKIILVSPSNITQHLPHTTTASSMPIQSTSSSIHQGNQKQASCLMNNSPVKLVKFTTNNNPTSLSTRAATLPINTNSSSTLTLPKNVQIVIPSQSSSAIQLTRSHGEDLPKTIPTVSTNPYRPINTMPVTLTTCAVDQIPQAAQEVTISASPNSTVPLLSNTIVDPVPPSSIGTAISATITDSRMQISATETSGHRRRSINESEDDKGQFLGKLRRRSSSSNLTEKPVGKVLRTIARVYPVCVYQSLCNNDHVTTSERINPLSIGSHPQTTLPHTATTRTSPVHDEMMKSVAVNIATPQPGQLAKPTSGHGPMIYRMTSVNPSVPVFRVRTTAAPPTTTVINKTVKTEPKTMAVTSNPNMCYEPKPSHSASSANNSVSVLACFKTTKKRHKERAIMPRPSTNESNETPQEQQRLGTNLSSINSNSCQIQPGDLLTNNASLEYQQMLSTSPNLLPQMSVSSTLSDDPSSNQLFSSLQESNHDSTISSVDSIPVALNHSTPPDACEPSIQSLSSPLRKDRSRPTSPLPFQPSIDITEMETIDKSSFNKNDEEKNLESIHNEITMNDSTDKKRKETPNDDDQWIESAIRLLNDLLVRDEFKSLDSINQQDLVSKFDFIETSLITGFMLTIDEYYQAVLETKGEFIIDQTTNNVTVHRDSLFDYFEEEFLKLKQTLDVVKRQKQNLTNQ